MQTLNIKNPSPDSTSLHCREHSSYPRVFAGMWHILILMPDGKLYGIGNNDFQQICQPIGDTILKPTLMAENVISAAAGYRYSVYVTADGEVHLQGNGVLTDYFNGFSGASLVYAEMTADRYYIRDVSDRWNWFGENTYLSRKVPQECEILATLPEVSCVVESRDASASFDPYLYIGDDNYEKLLDDVKKNSVYQMLLEKYVSGNIEVQFRLKEAVQQSSRKLWNRTSIVQCVYIPEILYCNNYYPEPQQIDENIEETSISWAGSMPSSYAPTMVSPQVVKICHYGSSYVKLFCDGTVVMTVDGLSGALQGNGYKAVDVAMSQYAVLVVYENGEVIQYLAICSEQERFNCRLDGKGIAVPF